MIKFGELSDISHTLQDSLHDTGEGNGTCEGIVSSLYPQNVQAARFISNLEQLCDRACPGNYMWH
ncbi:MAG: hypothetical protein RID53_17795 [Coleofasciculus sp. B1-GNL1-01]|uniref:hypothetical protein n=1 Tax=Coleofasciculus sp. B1-GNL1-01 TaxID=3068484 RepID=UPI0032F3B8D5